MEQSILNSTKQVLHIGPDDESFDLNIMTHINSAFSDLHDLGVGPVEGFAIEDNTPVWASVSDSLVERNRIRTFIFLKVRMIFDPPQMVHLLTSMEKQLDEVTWRLSVGRETTAWVDPMPPSGDPDDLEPTVPVLDGGDL